MPRKPNPEATVIDVQVKTVAIADGAQAQNQLAELNAQAATAAKAMATRVNYEGTLTLGAIEDEIRFYQRRTVETCLELGKRLLVLKELAPHGEFQQRVEMLGITARTAQTFMNVTIKTLKSETVSLLTNRVKNVKAFLELVTHDDETIEDLSKLDEFDKMSASQLREAARAKDRVIATDKESLSSVRAELDALKARPKRIKTQDPDAALIELTKEAQGYATEALGMIRGRVRAALEALAEHHNQHGDDAVRVNMAGMLGQLQAELKALRDQYNLPDVAEAATNPDAPVWAEIRAHLGGKNAAAEGVTS